MFRNFKKAIERNVSDAFSSGPSTHTSHVNTVIDIGPYSLRLGHVFAEGGFSFVHIATPLHPRSTTIRYAVKRLPCQDPDAEAAARREIELLHAIPPHENIVAFHGATFHQGHAFLLFDLVDGGTLPECLARSSRTLSQEKRLTIFQNVVAAVVHMHAQTPPIAIRDVKLENVLYDRLASCYKLCDFGSASNIAKRHTTRKEILDAEEDIANSCSAMYRAPEIADVYTKQFVCEKVDVWALGCIWHALLYYKLPFDGMSSLQILKGLSAVPPEPRYPGEYVELLKAMLTISPAERIDSFALLERVDALLGRKTDDTLRKTGASLRKQRARDFGTEQASEPCRPEGDLLSFDAQPLPNVPTSSPARDASPHPTEGGTALQSNANNSTAPANRVATQEQGWADFDSAFGGAAAVAPVKMPPISSAPAKPLDEVDGEHARSRGSSLASFAAKPTESTSQQISRAKVRLPIGSAISQTASISQPTSDFASKGNEAASLIDFSDLQVTASKSKPSWTYDNRKRSAPSEQTSPPPVVDSTDLIDFGSG